MREKNVKTLNLKLPYANQEIYVGKDISKLAISKIESKEYSSIALIIDRNIKHWNPRFYKEIVEGLRPIIIIPILASERSKSLDQINTVLEKLLTARLNRKSAVVAVGGGIVGDLAGFLSSVYMRGVDFVFFPTTLMSQGDSIVGKVGISYRLLKNIIGSFSSPVMTFCDTKILVTLPNEEIALGLSEVIKHGAISSPVLFKHLTREVLSGLKGWRSYAWDELIYQSLKVKGKLVSGDPFDKKGLHKGLSFGHTIANALEGISDYRIRHGQAVVIGMAIESDLSLEMGYLSSSEHKPLIDLLKRTGLLKPLHRRFRIDTIIQILKQDKISDDGTITLVLPTRIGSFRVVSKLNENLISELLRKYV